MKNLIVTSILSLSSFFAVSQSAVAATQLPTLANPKIVVVAAPEFAAVQPTVWLEFDFTSCANMTFSSSIRRNGNTVRVGAVLPEFYMDCMGPSIERTYRLQIASDYRNESFVITNSIAPEFRSSLRPDDHRMCTMIAGMLVGPNGECVSFTNGCQLSSMREMGYEFPQNGECSNN